MVLLWPTWVTFMCGWFLFIFGAKAKCRIRRKGSLDEMLLIGTVLTPAGASDKLRVLVRSGKIAYVGDGCEPGLERRNGIDYTVIDCGESVISPGFINTHEHIAYSTVDPLKDFGERCDNRHDWRTGLRNHTKREAEVNGTVLDATRWGELRHIFSGTTSIVGGDMAPGLARNLDFVTGLEEGLDAPIATWDVFPLDDSAGILRNGDCDYGNRPIDRETAGKLHRYMAHVGEGVDDETKNEFRCLSSDTFDVTLKPDHEGGGISTDIIAPNLALIHALGLSEADFDLVAKRGAHVVWSPRSNVFLYGKTLNVSYLIQAGINVALGTDWLPSGSATMSREAVCARSVSEVSYGTNLDAKILWEMMTVNAARASHVEAQLGTIETGKLADIVVYSGPGPDPWAKAVYASSEDIELVMRGGKILLAGEGLHYLGSKSCETVMFGQYSPKTVCVADALGKGFAEFEFSLNGVYPAILPGVPPDEPTCFPTR